MSQVTADSSLSQSPASAKCPVCSADTSDADIFCSNCGSPTIAPPDNSNHLPRIAPPAKLQRWQYWAVHISIKDGTYVVNLNGRKLQDEEVWAYLDELGTEGWELVASAPHVGSQTTGRLQAAFTGTLREATSTMGYMLWFKRPI
jgi:hypothetical protein